MYLPKIKFTVITGDLSSIDKAEAKYKEMKDRIEDGVVALVIPTGISVDKLNEFNTKLDWQPVYVEDVVDLADYLDNVIDIMLPKDKGDLDKFKEALKFMTWRLEGLPSEYFELLANKYTSIDEVITASKTNDNHNDDPILSEAFQEISTFLERDYYIE